MIEAIENGRAVYRTNRTWESEGAKGVRAQALNQTEPQAERPLVCPRVARSLVEDVDLFFSGKEYLSWEVMRSSKQQTHSED